MGLGDKKKGVDPSEHRHKFVITSCPPRVTGTKRVKANAEGKEVQASGLAKVRRCGELHCMVQIVR